MNQGKYSIILLVVLFAGNVFAGRAGGASAQPPAVERIRYCENLHEASSVSSDGASQQDGRFEIVSIYNYKWRVAKGNAEAFKACAQGPLWTFIHWMKEQHRKAFGSNSIPGGVE